jgi:hypothetical protein
VVTDPLGLSGAPVSVADGLCVQLGQGERGRYRLLAGDGEGADDAAGPDSPAQTPRPAAKVMTVGLRVGILSSR